MEKRLIISSSESGAEKIEPRMRFMRDAWKVRKEQIISEPPALAIKFVRRIEELLETPISILSTSPRREDTILVKNPFSD